jgi:sarcosine oxidase gamma subunit
MPPSLANTFSEAEGARICWLGPDEWLVLMARERVGDAAQAAEFRRDG